MSIQNVKVRRQTESRRTSLSVCVLTGYERHFWIHPDLLHVMIAMTKWQSETGSRLGFTNIHGNTPVDAARNNAVKQMFSSGAEWLLQIDNDVVPPLNCLALMEQIGTRKIVGLPCPIEYVAGKVALNVGMKRGQDIHELRLSLHPEWQEVEYVGSGCLLVHRDVFAALDDPWFECSRSAELTQRQHTGEDFGFCEKARAKGFAIWTHAGFMCRHYKTSDLGERLVTQVLG